MVCAMCTVGRRGLTSSSSTPCLTSQIIPTSKAQATMEMLPDWYKGPLNLKPNTFKGLPDTMMMLAVVASLIQQRPFTFSFSSRLMVLEGLPETSSRATRH